MTQKLKFKKQLIWKWWKLYWIVKLLILVTAISQEITNNSTVKSMLLRKDQLLIEQQNQLLRN